MSHTPGPWEMDKVYPDEIDIFPTRDGPPAMGRWAEICTVKDNGDDIEADALLICAAPDLLDCLEKCVKVMTAQNYRLNENLIEACKAAIYKATQEN